MREKFKGISLIPYPLSLIPVLFSGCAIIVPPTGGPKDTHPPIAINYSPPDKSTEFKSKVIDITFNKYIQLKDLSKQFIISPPLKKLPVPKIKGKILEISLKKDTLLYNTTYTFNFGDAICDINEGNQLKNFQYVFSTGAYIDSLSIHGVAVDAFSHEPIKEGLILLFNDLGDSVPFKKKPSYVGQTDDTGRYHIDNIKNGTYKLIALSQGNGDYFYHPYSQSIAFLKEPLKLEKKDTVINLYLFSEIQPHLKFIAAKATGKGQILLIFNRPADSIKITPLHLDTTKQYQTMLQYSPTADSLTYWINYPNLDSLRIIVSRNPLLINNHKIKGMMDTAIIYNIPGYIAPLDTTRKKNKNKKAEKPPSLAVGLNISGNSSFDYHLPFSITFPHPVSKIDYSKISLTKRKDTLALKRVGKPSLFQLLMTPAEPLIPDSSYKFTLLPGAFTDFFGYRNDTIKMHFTIQEETYFGTLKLNLSFSKKAHYLVQLLADKGIFRQDTVSGNKSILYEGLPPNTYSIRVIEDDNNNGNWDIGDYMNHIEPEDVFYFGQQINIRSNWDLVQEWKVN